MQKILQWIDETADLRSENRLVRWLERIAFVFLILMTLSAPHSIAATQTAWLSGMLCCIIRLFIKPRPQFKFGWVDFAFAGFFVWSVISAVFSYAPDISINKLRNVCVFLIFYFVYYNVRTRKAARILVFGLIFSCMVNVIWAPLERFIGRGVEIQGVTENSPLKKALIYEGDALLRANNKKIKTPDDLITEIEQNETTKVQFYRPDFYATVEVKRSNLLNGNNSLEKLGFASWKKSRNWRSSGFYGHYTTYAEVLQLILSLVFGLFVSAFLTNRREDTEGAKGFFEKIFSIKQVQIFNSKFQISPFLLICILLMPLALLMTVTRASQFAFIISAFSISLLTGNRKFILTLTAIILPLALIGLFVLQQSRNVGFFDAKDNSTTWRQTVYREGFDLWTANARNFTAGVGMDSIKRYAKDWHLFDDGRLPMGHFHSTPLQIAVERGFPALVFWLLILGVYARTLIRNFKVQISNFRSDFAEKGIILGTFGGLIGFFTSGLVHYNLGDEEVAMVFYLLMGVSLFVCSEVTNNLKSEI
jgi:hypothetical protein